MIVGPFLASEALDAGLVNRHQLRTRYRPIVPGVYLDKTVVPTLYDRTEAAWLWSQRLAVIAGSAAAALHRTKWIDAAVDVDLFYDTTRPAAGVRVHRGRLHADEVQRLSGMLVTTPARTGFDLARFARVTDVDALLKATGITVADIEAVARRHRGAPGLRQLEQTLALVDAGAESPRETELRLLLQRSGLPPVQTQIEVRDEFGDYVARLDMGWPELRLAVEYDGDHHRTDRGQYVRDLRRLEELTRLGWVVIRVIKEDSDVQIIRKIREARALQSTRVTQRRKSG
jgi:very-short-patch-repair endonuclease